MDKKNKAAAKKPVEAKKYNAVSELDVKQKNDLAAWAYEIYSDCYKNCNAAPTEPEQIADDEAKNM